MSPLLIHAETSHPILSVVESRLLHPFGIEFKFPLPQQWLWMSSAVVLQRTRTAKLFHSFIGESFRKEEGKVKVIKKDLSSAKVNYTRHHSSSRNFRRKVPLETFYLSASSNASTKKSFSSAATMKEKLTFARITLVSFSLQNKFSKRGSFFCV